MKKIYNEEIINTWIKEDESEAVINNRYELLNSIMHPMYNFILEYSYYYSIKRDYGTGDKLTMIEVHLLTEINDNIGITVTQLANSWHKTTSAISQVVKKLIAQGFVVREINKLDAKIFNLMITEKGKKIVNAHKKYDNLDIIKTKKKLLEKFTVDELISFDKICIEYTNLLRTKEK